MPAPRDNRIWKVGLINEAQSAESAFSLLGDRWTVICFLPGGRPKRAVPCVCDRLIDVKHPIHNVKYTTACVDTQLLETAVFSTYKNEVQNVAKRRAAILHFSPFSGTLNTPRMGMQAVQRPMFPPQELSTLRAAQMRSRRVTHQFSEPEITRRSGSDGTWTVLSSPLRLLRCSDSFRDTLF